MLTIGRRRNANVSLEPIRKVALRGESRGKRHVYHRHFGIAQKLLCLFDTGVCLARKIRSLTRDARQKLDPSKKMRRDACHKVNPRTKLGRDARQEPSRRCPGFCVSEVS